MNMASHLNMMKKKGALKVKQVMHEYAEGDLHSGSKTGPIVRNRKQAIAIALNSRRKKV